MSFYTDTFIYGGGSFVLLNTHTSNSGHTYTDIGTPAVYILTGNAHAFYDGVALSTANPAGADYSVECTIDTTSGTSGGRLFGPIGRGSGTSVLTGYAVFLDTGGTLYLFSYSAGSAVSIGSAAITITAGQVWDVKLEMIGTAIKAYARINGSGAYGAARVSVTNSTVTAAGHPGIYCKGGSNAVPFFTAIQADDIASFAIGTPTISAITQTTLTVSVTAATGGTAPIAYELARAPDSGGTPGTYGAYGTPQAGLTWNETGLTAGTKYWWRVRATDSAGTPLVVVSGDGTATTTAAITLAITGSASIAPNVATTYTFTPSGSVSTVVTLSDGRTAGAGVFSPTTLTWSSSATAQTATYTPAGPNNVTLTGTGSGISVTGKAVTVAYAIDKQVVFLGDSLTNGAFVYAPNDYPTLALAKLNGSWTGTNYGVDGQSASTVAADTSGLAAAALARISATRDNNVVAQYGTNDLRLGRTNVQLMADLVTIKTAYKARAAIANPTGRFRFFANTIQPGYSPGNSILASYDLLTQQSWNAYLKANYAANDIDGVIDICSNPLVGQAGAETNATYFDADKVHMTAAGYGLVGQAVAAHLADSLYQTVSSGGGGGGSTSADDTITIEADPMLENGVPHGFTGTAPTSAGAPSIIVADSVPLGGRAGILLQNRHATLSIYWGGSDVTASLGAELAAGKSVYIRAMEGPLYCISATTTAVTVGGIEWRRT